MHSKAETKRDYEIDKAQPGNPEETVTAKTPIGATALWATLVVLATLCLDFTPYIYEGDRYPLPRAQYVVGAYALAMSIWVGVSQRERLRQRLPRLYVIAISAVFLIFSASALASQYPFEALRLLSIIFIFSAAATAPVAISAESDLRQFVIFLGALSGIVTVTTIALEITGPIAISPHYAIYNYIFADRSGGTPRWASFFLQANGFGEYLMVGMIAAMYMALQPSVRILRWLGLLFFCCDSFAFWMTGSRGAAIGIAIGILTFVITFLRIKGVGLFKAILSTLVACIFIGMAVWLLDCDGWSGASAFLNRHTTNISSGRFQLWTYTLKLWWDSPWLGYGFGRSVKLFVGPGMAAHSPLNVFFGILGETGLLGLLAFLFLWGSSLFRAASALRLAIESNQHELSALAAATLAFLMGFAAQQLGEWTIFRVTFMHIVFFSILTLAWRLPTVMHQPHDTANTAKFHKANRQ